jgi:uncharacterized protein YecE (DUF72 family)
VAEVSAPAGAVIRTGTAGWSYRDWEGIVYPAEAGLRFDRLGFMASLFDTLEINTFFYRLPEERQVATWARRVAERSRFRFTVKAWRALTHDDHEEGAQALRQAVADFAARLPPLAASGRLGAVLLQFPFRFRPDPAGWERLGLLVGALEGLPLVAEFRRREWGEPAALERLRGLGVGFCNIDQPALPGNLPPSCHVTARLGYVRLHGRNARDWFREGAGRDARYDYLYSPEEIAEWAVRVRDIAAAGAEEIFVIANNHYRGKAACNALELRRALEDPGAAAPQPLAEAFPRLGAGRAPRQGRLF